MTIEYLRNSDIDKSKWDDCIKQAPNGLIYAFSCYLDQMSPGWDALVAGDYEWIMPLTQKKKLGITYLSQPPFSQQLGIFSRHPVPQEVSNSFIQEINKHFRFAEISLNYANQVNKNVIQRSNFLLPLDKPLPVIEQGFRKDLKQNIKKAQDKNLLYLSSENYEEAVLLYEKNYATRLQLPRGSFEHFLQLCKVLHQKGQVLIRKVTNPQGKFLAIGVFLKDQKRIYKMMTTTSGEGRNLEANHLLLYGLIREFAGQDLILDFCGSEVPTISAFLKKFGPIEQPYYFMKLNQLPSPISSVKNIYDKIRKRKKTL